VIKELEEEAQRNEIKQALREHREETRRHVANVEQCFKLLGEEIDDSPCPTIEGLAKEDKAADVDASRPRPVVATTNRRPLRGR
jgi:ferritin-like metal-binding protein YciE